MSSCLHSLNHSLKVSLACLHLQVLDGLLAQYGTVESCEQGRMCSSADRHFSNPYIKRLVNLSSFVLFHPQSTLTQRLLLSTCDMPPRTKPESEYHPPPIRPARSPLRPLQSVSVPRLAVKCETVSSTCTAIWFYSAIIITHSVPPTV